MSSFSKDISKNKSALSTRWAQMSKQEQIIERKKIEIQAKLDAQKQAAALAAEAKLSKPTSVEESNSNNIFSNDGTFMNHFKALLEKQKKDKNEKEIQEQKEQKEKQQTEKAPEESKPEKKEQKKETKPERSHNNRRNDRHSGHHRDERRHNEDSGPRERDRERNRRWDRNRNRNHSPMTPVVEDRHRHDTKNIPSLMQFPIMPPNENSNASSDDQWDMSGPPNYDMNGRNNGPNGNRPFMDMGPNSIHFNMSSSSFGPGGPPMSGGPMPPSMGPNVMMPPGGPMPPCGSMPPMGSGPPIPPGGPMGGPPMPPGGPMGSGPLMPPGGPMGSGPPMPSGGPMGSGPPMPPSGPMGSGPPMPPGGPIGTGGPMGSGPPMPPGGPMGSGPLLPSGGPMGTGPPMASGNRQPLQSGGPMGNGPPMPPGGPMGNGPPMPPSSMGSGPPMPPGGPMPPFMNGPNFPPMPPFMGPNGPNMCGRGSNGPPPFFGPPFGPNGPMMGPNGPSSMMQNSNGNMPFIPHPPFGPNGPNFGNNPQNLPFIPPPPNSMPSNLMDMKHRDDTTNVDSIDKVFSTDTIGAVHRAAADVARNGDRYENMLKVQPHLWFLNNTHCNEYRAFRELVNKYSNEERKPEIKPEDKYEPEFSLEDDESNDANYNVKEENYQDSFQLNVYQPNQGQSKWEPSMKRDYSSQSDDEQESKKERRRRKKSRWGDDPPVDLQPPPLMAQLPMPPLPPPNLLGPQLSKIDEEGFKLTTVNRNNQALMQYAMTNYGTTNLNAEDWKKCEDNFKLNLLYQDMLKKRQEVERLAAAGKNKYEYDSDEDVNDGTWEHKLRAREMNATERWADELTKQAAGKHHIGDFLPPEELKKFMEKYSSVKSGKEPDLSDYKEFKLKEDNVGFKMLQKLGWSEGQGLGAEGTGIVDPVNKAQQPVSNLGLGAAMSDSVSPDDDEFDAYRKRMMLAYRFRPNPLNNPRRPYY